MPWWKWLHNSDVWAENDGMFIWLSEHTVHILLALFGIAIFLAWVISKEEEK